MFNTQKTIQISKKLRQIPKTPWIKHKSISMQIILVQKNRLNKLLKRPFQIKLKMTKPKRRVMTKLRTRQIRFKRKIKSHSKTSSIWTNPVQLMMITSKKNQ